MRNIDPDIIGTDPRTAAPDFGLFAQRIASPEAAHSVEVSGTRSVSRPVARIEMPGASQAAREAIAPHLSKLQTKVLTALVVYGPCTRDRLCEVLGMNPNTLRPRIVELLDRNRIVVVGYASSPRRELLAVAPTPEPETDR